MKILADENIPYVQEAFSSLGDVVLRPGRSMAPEDVRDADILLVRSITRVDARLLDGSAVQFVATATIGEDHIDRPFLADRDIGFSSAPGCNANSVGEYVVAGLLHLAGKHQLSLAECAIGIVGVGNVGSNVAEKAAALGMQVVLNDPPLGDATGDARYCPLDDILACDVVTTHVPLTDTPPYPTRHLVDEDFLERMKPGGFYINTARGAVADNGAVLHALTNGRLRGAILDVWEDEPAVRLDVLDMVDIATPHIAGYSFDGKVKGTRQIYEAACRHFGRNPDWDPAPLLPPAKHPEIPYCDRANFLKTAVDTVYPILQDDEQMRALVNQPVEKRPEYFDQLRKNYPQRREFYNTTITGTPSANGTAATLEALGFVVQREA